MFVLYDYFIIRIVCNLAFYGVGLKSNDLGINPYFSFAVSAFIGLIAYLVCYVLIKRFGRKYPYIFSLFVNGIACTSIYFIGS